MLQPALVAAFPSAGFLTHATMQVEHGVPRAKIFKHGVPRSKIFENCPVQLKKGSTSMWRLTKEILLPLPMAAARYTESVAHAGANRNPGLSQRTALTAATCTTGSAAISCSHGTAHICRRVLDRRHDSFVASSVAAKGNTNWRLNSVSILWPSGLLAKTCLRPCASS